MQSFPITIKLKGLRPDKRLGNNIPAMEQCDFLKPKFDGLTVHRTFSDPISTAQKTAHSIVYSFPFPQLYRSAQNKLVLDYDKIYSANGSWTLTELAFYSTTAQSLPVSIIGDEIWQIADFNDTVVMCNQSMLLMIAPGFNLATDAELTNCVARDEGRLLLGGINPSYTHPLWDNYGWNMFYYGPIGGGDTVWLFDSTAISSSEKEFLQKKDTAGFIRMPFEGRILAILPIGQNYVVVYGADGIAVLQRTIVNDVSHYGVIRHYPFGIASRGSVDGDDNVHCFIDQLGYLWLMTADLKMERQDFSEFLSSFVGSTHKVTFDPQERDFYICSSTICYVLSDGGLSKGPQKISSIMFEGTYAYSATAASAETQYTLLTTPYDIGVSEVKSGTFLEVRGRQLTGITYTPYIGKPNSDTFTQCLAVAVNSDGFAYSRATGTQFKIKLVGTIGANTRIDELTLWWQRADKRVTRGPRAT